jgi:hypothetical protein
MFIDVRRGWGLGMQAMHINGVWQAAFQVRNLGPLKRERKATLSWVPYLGGWIPAGGVDGRK